MGLNLVAEEWGESGVARENLEKGLFELHVDRRLGLSRRSQCLDLSPLALLYQVLSGI